MSIITPQMQQLAKDIDYQWERRAPAVLLPYQQRWMADKSQVKVDEKSRRIGLSWAESCDAVLEAAASADAGGDDVWYIGYTKDMAIEFILDAAQWAIHFQSVADAIEVSEDVFVDGEEKKSVFAFSIRFASGFRITALSSQPRNLRGKQGRVILDEAAFHQNLAALLKAAMALLIWGGRVHIISTHFGDDNPFAELVKDIRSGRLPYSLHRTTFDDAMADGLYRRICLKTGIDWTKEGEDKWAADIRAFYGDDAAEELDCVPKNGDGVWLSRALIERCMRQDIPVLRLEKPPEFTFVPKWQRLGEINDWLEENVKPLIAKMPPGLMTSMGGDFARTGDLSVFYPLAQLQNLKHRMPFLIELRGMPFDCQRLVLFYLIKHLPGFRHAALDARGLGAQLAEEAAQEFGPSVVSQVMQSETWYRENMPPYKAAFEDCMIEIAQDADVLNDHRAVKVVKGVARVPDLRTQDAAKKKRHGDSAVAGALAWYASRQDGGPVAVASRRSRRESVDMGGY
jgi:phage FluMu gp28-like protein